MEQPQDVNMPSRPRPVVRKDIKRTIPQPADKREPTYWTTNRWGVPAHPNQSLALPSPNSPEKHKAAKHYQKAPVPGIRSPDSTVFNTLNELETLMRTTLGAMANFNEDERMILTRQFKREVDKSRARGEYSPPGLVNLGQFIHTWKKFSVRVTEDQACALFIKYGHDSQGLLPYDMFATKLLSSPARLLALEPEQRGPYKSGRDGTFKGKILYRFCRKPVFPPSNWDGSLAVRSARKPKAGLKLEFVYGYSGKDNTASNLFWTSTNKAVYYVAAVGIVYDPETHTQTFFKGHDDDIKCMAIHPERNIVATGQVASALDGSAAGPYVCIWDTRDVTGLITRIDYPNAEGQSSRYIVALGFSGDGNRLVVVTGDNRHTVSIYHWRSRQLISTGVGQNGQPPAVYGVEWNNHTKGRDADGNAIIAPVMFVTYGVKHMKLWNLLRDQKTGQESYTSQMFKFGKFSPSDVLCACFISADLLVSGTQGGEVLLWDVGGRRTGVATCIQAVNAHGPGVKAPSIHDGQMVLQGVRAMCLRANNSELVTGGSDGQLLVWDISTGELARMIKAIKFAEVGESTPCSFRSLDSKPGSYDLLAGTNRCEVWEVARNDNPEPLLQGHTSDVYGCAWHPKKPYKFATACDSSNVFLWNARRRQLIAKVNIGLPARSVAFSPNGAHLAVGTGAGVIKVLMVENLTQKVAEMSYSKEDVKVLRYSPDGTKLAAGSHDNSIDIYDVTRGYARLVRCNGHSSYITHIDWALDGRAIQSTCGAYELLYFDATTGKQVQQNQRDTLWNTWTCVLGFPVMGIWQDDNDGTDINSCCRSFSNPAFGDTDPLLGSDGPLVVTSGDDGRVRLFNYPCVVQSAPNRAYIGHCSHVMGVRFSPHNRWMLSVGGSDRSAMQWRLLTEAEEDLLVDRPQVEPYHVYEAPQRRGVVEDPFSVAPTAAGDLNNLPLGRGANALLPNEAAAAAAAADAKRQDELERLRKENQRSYEITTITSDIKGAACNARVFAIVSGSKGTSPELKLENGPDNFSRGKTDKFTFDLQDLGVLDKLVIGHDGSGTCPRWHCDKIIIVNRSQPDMPPVIFTCGNWFARDVGDGQIMRTLKLGAGPPLTRTYQICVQTSDIKGAGTDANVFITLFGEQDGKALNSGAIRLENSQNNFERGQTDTFQIQATIGELKYIKIGHDNTGLGPSWHLQEVLINSPGMPDKQFPANRWLSTDDGDKQTYCVLYPTGPDGKAQGQPRKYRVMVYTSDIRGAGTDARVYINMFGPGGVSSGRTLLENSKNNFERGQEDIFFLTSPDLGDLTEVEIEHDNSGASPGWHCEQVVVVDETNNRRYAFPCDRWLAKDEDDGLIRRRLQACSSSSPTTTYRVTTYTSDCRGAGTDANVYVEVCGCVKPGGQEVWGPRTVLDNSKNNFERSAVDTFLLKKHKNLGTLQRIKIGHDNSGAGPGWHLDHVEVIDDATGTLYYFPCNKWLDKKEEDGCIERILQVAPRDARAEKAQYKITVHTSDIKYAGTDANVSLQIFGEMDGVVKSTERVALSNSKNNFERGQVDVFNLTLSNVGEVKRILIGHDDAGAGSDWHLNMVEVLCVNTGQHAKFYYNGWLSKSEAPYKLEVELFPEGGDKPPLCRYTVTTYTSDCRGAGTDANVSCILFGEKGQTPSTKLENSSNNFERGQRDEFVIESIDIGKLQKLQIGHDDSGLGPAWHLSHVEVVAQSTGDRYYFLADQWLDKKQGTLTLMLEPSNAKGAKQMFKVSVQTGDQRGAGTDRDISIILFGTKGTSQEMRLESSANNFERNMLDEFKLDLGQQDLGDITKVEIGFATQQSLTTKMVGLFGQQWYLSTVEVVHFNNNARTFFLYDDWINDKKRRVQLVPGKAGENNVYKVVVRTSDIRGTGTDSNISLAVFGEKDGKMVDTGLHKLDNSQNNFERNATDIFMIKSKDVGDMKRVQLSSDGTGFGASWHCDQVEVTDTQRGVTLTFPCGKWLDPSDPASLDQTLLPRGADGSIQGLLTYEVVFYTSDLRGAGTDSNVSIQIWGDKDHTSALKCETSANNFERGCKDLFKLQSVDVGDISHVVVKKDAAGLMGNDWHLQSVEVWQPVLKKRYFFVCGDWLKGACERKLEAGKVPTNGRCTYRVLVTTSDQRGARTDANVSMTLFGDKGDTGVRKLDSSANDFERGKVDTFFFEAPDVGMFQSLRIGHDNSGLGSAWHLAKVEIVNTNTGEQAVFPCHKWLDKDTGLEVLLTPDRDGDGVGDVLMAANMTEYTISVNTSDVRGAGTDANVFIELYGDKGCVGEQRLDTNQNNFERGRKDVFKVKSTNVGELQKVIIRHDNSGLASDWHCEQVEVFSAATNKTYFFPCNAWLKKEGADESGLRKELLAGPADAKGRAQGYVRRVATAYVAAGSTNYRINVYTSDIRGAGTDADVYLVIYGEKGDTGERKLDNSTNNFERGKVDTFFLPAPNVGAMQRVKVRCTGGGLGAAWHLAKVEITSSATGETLVFPFVNWLDKEHGLEQVLWPDRDGDGKGDVGVAGDVVKYRVAVYTSDIRGAGTDANVSVEIHGNKAFIGSTRLDNAANNFERGRKDEFEISGSDVGELDHIIIGHDNTGLGSSWHLSQVEVYHPVLGKTYTFPCNEWLEATKDQGVGGCKRVLKTGAAAAADGNVTYRVLVKTSDVRGAGTDSNVSLVIYGPKGDTGERPLETHANNFERGQLDTFIIQGPDVGELDRICIRSDGGGLGSAWHLQQVDILSSATNASYHFPFNNWIHDKHGLQHVIWKDSVQGARDALVDYRITVYTSDVRGAGTDANVYIEMFGEKGCVGKSQLESHGNNFERGQVDTFVLKGSDIGDITKVIIGHDNSGVGSAWHCKQVDVFSPATQKTYSFPCDAWLEASKDQGEKGCRKELVAGSGAGSNVCSYKVEVKTGDVRGAGTDANVQVCVYGIKGDTGSQALENSRNNFERNQLDTFFIKAPDIGDMTTCKVVCDGSGLGASWYLDYIKVTNATSGTTATFTYGNWLDDKAGWSQLLTCGGTRGAAATKTLVDYQITVTTSDIRGAGTDGEVYISLKGTTGAMGETKLENNRSNFSRGAVDVFMVQGSDIGLVKDITLRLDEKGLGAAWHLTQVEVLNKKTGAKATFVFNDWLEKCAKYPDATVTLLEASSDEAKAQQKTVHWKVVTQTANVFGAGTDAPVRIKVEGPAGLQLGGGEIFLDNSKNNFERGATDTFTLQFPVDKDCGTPIARLVVERGASCGCGSDWLMDFIEVTDTSRGHTYKWTCTQWFNDKEGIRKEWSQDKAAQGLPQALQLVEAPLGAPGSRDGAAAGAAAGGASSYRLVFKTSDKMGAGTDATVRCELTDVRGTTWQPVFAQDKSMFERNTSQDFIVSSMKPLQDLAAAKVWLDHSGLGDAWHLEYLDVTALPSQRSWRFAFNNWIPKEGATVPAQVTNDVPLVAVAQDKAASASDGQPGGDQDVIRGTDQAPGQPAAAPQPIQYDVTVYTGNKYGAGTDSLITCNITGTAGNAQYTFDQAKKLFERGSIDRFSLRLPDCGQITSLKIWHDGSGFGSDWYLSKICIEAVPHGCKYEASFEAWITGGQDKAVEVPVRLVSGDPSAAVNPAGQVQGSAPSIGATGIDPRILDQEQFHNLLWVRESDLPQQQAQQQPAGQQAAGKRQGPGHPAAATPQEPTCMWQRYTMPYQQDPRYIVTYYHNAMTGASTYDKPKEYADWEQQYTAYLSTVVK